MPMLRVNFEAYSLNTETEAVVYLPQEGCDFINAGPRKNADGKIPAVWLLHGVGDDQTGWQRFTDVETYASKRGIAVLIPRVNQQSMYANMQNGLPYFDFITKEFPDIMRQLFPQLSEKREDNYIGGLSMGGYGALKIGLTLPENYGHVGCLSCGNLVDMETPDYAACQSFIRPMCGAPMVAFGKKKFRDALGTKDDLVWLLDKDKQEGKTLPDIFMACGEQDPLLPMSESFAAEIRKRFGDAAVTHKTGPGSHEWAFWNTWLEKWLNHAGLTEGLTKNEGLEALVK